MTNKQLDTLILRYIQTGIENYDAAKFNRLALQVFAFQRENNPVYRKYCYEQGTLTSDEISYWHQIPPLPSSLFKQEDVTSFSTEQTELLIKTGGTTDPKRRGLIYRNRQAIGMVFAANQMMTRSYLFPDVERMQILFMVPSLEIAPTMGMAVGLEETRKRFGTDESRFLISAKGLDIQGLYLDLRKAEEMGKPLALIGVTAGFIFFFKYCKIRRWRFALPPGSRVCDGGGYMGLFGDYSRENYYQMVQEYLGVPPEYCVNTYGMGESGTNYFDNVLRNKLLGEGSRPRTKISPPWARTLVIDRETGEQLPFGQEGVICHYDLSNYWNALAVRTEDVGYQVDELSFEITGRLPGQKVRPPGHPAWMPTSTDGFSRMKEMVLNIFCKGLGEPDFANYGDSCAVVAEELLVDQAKNGE